MYIIPIIITTIILYDYILSYNNIYIYIYIYIIPIITIMESADPHWTCGLRPKVTSAWAVHLSLSLSVCIYIYIYI